MQRDSIPARDRKFIRSAAALRSLPALLFLIAIAFTSHLGAGIINLIPLVYPNRLDVLAGQTNSVLMPLSLLAYELMLINIVLAVALVFFIVGLVIPPKLQRVSSKFIDENIVLSSHRQTGQRQEEQALTRCQRHANP